MRNQTQFGVELAAKMALHDWVVSGERTYERLMALADHYADRLRGKIVSTGAIPKVMVWREALRLLQERIPDCAPGASVPQTPAHSDNA